MRAPLSHLLRLFQHMMFNERVFSRLGYIVYCYGYGFFRFFSLNSVSYSFVVRLLRGCFNLIYYIFKCGLHYLAMFKLFQQNIFACLTKEFSHV